MTATMSEHRIFDFGACFEALDFELSRWSQKLEFTACGSVIVWNYL
jgi:hypothetical protein